MLKVLHLQKAIDALQRNKNVHLFGENTNVPYIFLPQWEREKELTKALPLTNNGKRVTIGTNTDFLMA